MEVLCLPVQLGCSRSLGTKLCRVHISNVYLLLCFDHSCPQTSIRNPSRLQLWIVSVRSLLPDDNGPFVVIAHPLIYILARADSAPLTIKNHKDCRVDFILCKENFDLYLCCVFNAHKSRDVVLHALLEALWSL